jgi:hypothetical protein
LRVTGISADGEVTLCENAQLTSCCVRVCLAGTIVTFSITASNTGAVRLKNLTVGLPPWAHLRNCTPALPGTIPVYGSMVCFADYTFDQDFYEAGPLSFSAWAKPNELPAAVQSQPTVVTPTYTPSLVYHQGSCTLPAAARKHLPAHSECLQ